MGRSSNLLYFYGTMAKRRHSHEAHYNPSFFLIKVERASLPNSSADTRDVKPGMKTPSCTRTKWIIGYSFRPSISSAVICPANSPIGCLSALEIL
jgi:hypothetical protein